MAVIKCSNCENDILDSEIVCPYCDCPISETIRKMKSYDLQNYSDNLVTDLTGRIPSPVKETASPGTEADYDFEKKKAEILKDLEIIDEAPSDDSDSKKEQAESFKEIKDDTAQIPVVTANTDQTVKISREDLSKNVPVKNENNKKTAVQKKNNKTGNGNKLIIGTTIAGIIVIGILIWGLISLISGGNEKPAEKINSAASENKVKSDSDKVKGFELKSSTLTITDNSVMTDYASPNETPWYEYRNKIKHVVFSDNITKIGAHSFEGFEKITDISIPDSVEKIGESAFCNCSSLKEINDISKNLVEIDDYAFTGCKKLSKIPGYTQEAEFEPTIERIGIEAFKSCKSLEEFKLPMYTKIGTDAFYGHGESFVLVCETTSEAYDYAIEKGIPTKLAFGDEIPEEKPEEEKTNEPQNENNTKPSESKEPAAEQTPTEPTPSDKPDTSTPNQPQSSGKTLSELMDQLGSATTQEEKDKILSEIDKITQ